MKIENSKIFKKALEKYSNGKINLDSPSGKKFVDKMMAAVILLIPEIAEYLVDTDLDENMEIIPLIAMATAGETLMETAKVHLKRIKEEEGDNYENFNNVIFNKFNSKLYQ